ncbi:MAG: GFA family protein [Xanthobacteraceae bacterium]
MKTRVASCACGQLSVSCDGDPLTVSLCHCLACQRRTGSIYGIAAFFACSDVKVAGEASDYSRPSDSGQPVTFHFCPRCGSTVFWEPARNPDLVAVAVGAFGDPSFPRQRRAFIPNIDITGSKLQTETPLPKRSLFLPPLRGHFPQWRGRKVR